MEKLERVKKFIEDNDLDFYGSGSELNGNCVILAGFICYVITREPVFTSVDGWEIINGLKLNEDAHKETYRVFEYAYVNDYEKFWTTEEAKEQYKF